LYSILSFFAMKCVPSANEMRRFSASFEGIRES
jgi:hypothetical protein